MELSNAELEVLAQEFKAMLDKANVDIANLSMRLRLQAQNNQQLVETVRDLETQLDYYKQLAEDLGRSQQQNLAEE